MFAPREWETGWNLTTASTTDLAIHHNSFVRWINMSLRVVAIVHFSGNFVVEDKPDGLSREKDGPQDCVEAYALSETN